ncbi:MAG: anti-sigma factor domain-containing protein [Acidimicrobiia bacterium]
MDRELTPAELDELLPAYALDALDDDERAAVEAHLAVDPHARDEVASLQRAASFLAHTGGPPPVGVWEKLEATIRAKPGPSGEVPPPRLLPLAQSGPPGERTSRRWQIVAAAAVVVALAMFSLWAFDRGGSERTLDTAAAADGAATTPGARHATLRDADGTTLARAVVLPDGTGYVTTAKLPALGTGRTYQLWGVDDRATISLGVMGPDPKVVAFHTDRPPSALAITNERAGGVVSSAESPTAVGDLRA